MSQLQKSTLKFLKDLAAQNNKSWFEANKRAYEAAKADFIAFNSAVIKEIARFAPEFGALDAKKTVFRIYRDVRFSKDKRPYKENFGANLGIGKGGSIAGFYLQIQPGKNSFAAAGAYMPEPPALQAMRQEIDYNFEGFNKILRSATFKKHFDGLDEIEKLKTNPKGYQADNPAIEILKHKSFVVSKSYTDSDVTAPDFLKEISAAFKAAYPFVKFLNDSVK